MSAQCVRNNQFWAVTICYLPAGVRTLSEHAQVAYQEDDRYRNRSLISYQSLKQSSELYFCMIGLLSEPSVPSIYSLSDLSFNAMNRYWVLP